MNEKQIAKILVHKLLDMGFVVHRYNAITTNSIYLKLELSQLLNMVEKERESKIRRYGLENYKLYMKKEKQENELFKRFRKVA